MAAIVEFKDWLDEKLRNLNTDENIFGSYIQSILDGDDSSEEKTEALQGIISEIIGDDVEISKLCEEIMDKWRLYQSKEPPPAAPNSEDINDKLAKLLECQLPTTKQKHYTEEEKKIREAILSQYSQMTDSEEEEADSGHTTSAKEKSGGIEKNINAQLVADAEKQKREHAKEESHKKKEKDREDREKQKNLKEEKKEKRKTQKGERRR